MLSFVLVSAALATCGCHAQSDIPISQPLQNILSMAANSSLTTYPTHLTQGIVPKFFHSHNDYWRPVPFYSALSVGGVSVEADVWYEPARSNRKISRATVSMSGDYVEKTEHGQKPYMSAMRSVP